MLDSCGSEVTEKLRHVFSRNRTGGFYLEQENPLDHQVGPKFPEGSPVFVTNRKGHLRFHFDPLLAQAVNQGVLVHLLEVAWAEIVVDRQGGLAHEIAKLEWA